MHSAIKNWLERHQHPVSFWLHMVGIPLAVGGLILGGVQLIQWRWDLWWRPTILIFVGYLLQWIGHRIEGNDVGEIILVKKWLGMPYVAISPKFSVEKPLEKRLRP
ncbi:MAG: Mpo1-like protein [Planctomycetota bacterium]